jgi:stage II sporulation protein D
MISLQKQYYFCNIVLIVCLLLLASGCARRRPSVEKPVERPPAERPSTRPGAPEYKLPSAVPRPAEPTIRIGLKTDSKSVTINCDGAVQFSDGSHTRKADSTVLASLSFIANNTARYFVQVGSYSTRENAERARRMLKTSYPSMIFENPDLGQFQLRLGPFSTQERAQQVVDELKTQSIQAFYISDTQSFENLPDLIVRDELGGLLLRANHPVEFWCRDQAPISADSVPYRGYLSVFVNSSARLTVVNGLNFEDYLKGVVANEIGPASATTFEALKAQAVAARTYAYKNLRQFDQQGYDICATPRCQVYSGYKTENAFTSRAVEETSGQILEYGGQPINALYTSTCGGRTENAEYVFEGWNYPYLKSVECYPEEEKVASRSVEIQGRKETWDRAWLSLKAGMQTANNPEAPVTAQEVQQGMLLLLNSLGKVSCSASGLVSNHWADISDFVVSSLCWQKRRDSLLDRKDYQYFTNRLQLTGNPTTQTQSLLFLLHDEIVNPPEEERNFDPNSPMKRKFFWEIFYNVLKHYHQINTADGLVREMSRNSMQVVDDVGVHSFGFKPNFYLYQKFGETISPHSSITCAPGDQVEYLLDDSQQVTLLICEVNPSGISMDRSSKVSFWQETVTPAELGKRVSKYLDVGDVTDLQPLSYGLSGRVYELRITGTRGSGTLRGIRVRWALGLKDNLFVIERTFDRSGKVKEFVFTGRGWGHGVGMCQIGAIGFAKQGKSYDWILKHYYTGVSIKKEY